MTLANAHTYRNGRPYRRPHSSVLPSPYMGRTSLAPCIAVPGPELDWPDLWTAVQRELREAQFAASTLLLYRRILRTFRTFAAQHPHPALRAERPSDVRKAVVEAFIHHINRNRASGSWLSGNIAVLRTVFDKLAGFTVTARLQTPKRPWRLPEFLSASEAARLIETASTIRDRLLIGLLYGCGLKTGEVCALRWEDVLIARRCLVVRYARGSLTRELPIPAALFDILELGVAQCPSVDYVFPGARPGKPLTERLIERMVRRTADAAGIGKDVTCMILRHSYAVDCLRQGMSPAQLRQNLGHRSIATTLDYRRCILSDDTVSPADSLKSFDSPCAPMLTPAHSHTPALPSLRYPVTPTLRYIPFPFPAIPSGPRQFLSMLKTCIGKRFLGLRAFVGNTS